MYNIENKFLIGCCYYPEHWDASDMERDLSRIKDLGFNTIRMGEFSWSMYERREGEYDFSFLLKAVEAAERLGLYVILGTPTAAPPKWLTDKHPEVLAVTRDGVTMQHGSRQHHNHTSEVYLGYCEKITEEMLKCFCHCKNVIGWQIDNELNCHRKESYAKSDDEAFARWLSEKYGTVERLNETWGNRFWSLEFNDFSEITCPRPNPAYDNPAWMTDYYLFLSDTVINFASVQTKIIRKYMPDAFITHNGYFQNIDYRRLTDECLDILAFDSYPAFQERASRGAGRNVAYKLAETRACSDRFLILEQQSGPGGQLSYLLPTPLPGQIRLWTYQSIAHGAVGVLYFRYRTALYGAEQLWYGIYDHDGKENYRSREIRKIAEEIGRLGSVFTAERKRNDVAIYSDYRNECINKVESFVPSDKWEIFTELNREGIHADFVNTPKNIAKYKVVIFPHITIADKELRLAIEKFTENGGIAIISARSGTKDEYAQYRPDTPPAIFGELAGCRVTWFTAMTKSDKQSVDFGGKLYAVDGYFELLECEGGETLGRYTEGFPCEKSAIVKNGNVYYVGFYSHIAPELYTDIIRRHLDCTPAFDRELEEINMGEYKMYLNHTEKTFSISGYDELEERMIDGLEAYGVALIKTK